MITKEATQLAPAKFSILWSVCINRKTGLLLKPELNSHEWCSGSHGNTVLSSGPGCPSCWCFPFEGCFSSEGLWVVVLGVWWSPTSQDAACPLICLDHHFCCTLTRPVGLDHGESTDVTYFRHEAMPFIFLSFYTTNLSLFYEVTWSDGLSWEAWWSEDPSCSLAQSFFCVILKIWYEQQTWIKVKLHWKQNDQNRCDSHFLCSSSCTRSIFMTEDMESILVHIQTPLWCELLIIQSMIYWWIYWLEALYNGDCAVGVVMYVQ